MGFSLKRKSVKENFPFPDDGSVIYETAPCLIWVPTDTDAEYSVTVKNSSGEVVFEDRTVKNYTYPERPWSAGDYTWNVVDDKGNERGWHSFSVSTDAVTFIRPTAKQVWDGVPGAQRPRHLFYASDRDELLRDHLAELKILNKNLELAYDHGMPSAPRYAHDADALPYREYFGQYRDYCDRDLIACALAYALCDDARAGEHGKELLLTICDMNPLGPCSLMGEWGDEVGLSNARCLPAAFDMLYALLDEKQRKYVAQTIAVYARQCEARIRKIDYVRNPSNSHVGRLPAYLGEAALVLKGTGVEADETLLAWLEYALEIYNGIFPFYGCQDGSWAEGAFYSTSYTKWYLPFFSAVERFCGISLFARPFYIRYTRYLMHFCNENYDIHPFGDGYWCHPSDDEWPGFFAQDPYRVYAERFGTKTIKERKDYIVSQKIDYFRLHLLDIFLPESNVTLPTSLIPTEENCAFFPYGGYAVLHTDMKSEYDICVMARASRYVADSHRHADQGSFAIFCGGESLIAPSGFFGRRYGSKHHFEWTKQTVAHNVALINGQGQGSGPDTACAITSFDGEKKTFTMDITPAYEGRVARYLRTVSLDSAGVTITDEIEADVPVEVVYPLHSYGMPTCISGNVVQICRENASLVIEPFDGELSLERITDKYGTDLNEGEPPEYHVTMPKQYHIYYFAPKSKCHRITVHYTVKSVKG